MKSKTRFAFRNPFLRSLLAAGSAAIFTGHLHAASQTWSGTTNDGGLGWSAWTSWSPNWDGSTVGFGNGNDVVFDGGGTSYDGGTNYGAAVWEGQNYNVGSMSFSTKNYTIGTKPGTTGYSASLTLTNGNIDVASGVTATFLNNAGAGQSFSLHGSAGITKTGAGTLFLNLPSDVSGTITVSGGTLKLADGDWITGNPWGGGGMNGAIIVGSGATLSTSEGVTEIKNGLTLNGGTVSSRGNTYGTGNGSWGNLVLSSNISAGNSATSTISSEIRLSDNRSIDVGSGSTLNMTGGIAIWPINSGSYGITKAGAGTLNLGGANTYTGTTTISGGKISLTGTSSLPTTGAVTIAAGATLSNDAAANTSFNIGAITLNGGTLAATSSPASNLGNFHLKGNVTVGGTSTSTISADVRVIENDDRNFIVAATGDASGVDLLLSGKLGHYNGSSWGYATKSGAGVMKITGSNEIGRLTVSEGKLILENSGIGGMWSGGLINNAQSELSVTGSNTVSFGQAISGNGTIDKTGTGTLTLSGSNTYDGATTVSAGTLLITGELGNTAVTVESSGTVGGSGSIAGSLNFGAGANLTVNLADPLAITGAVTFANFDFTDIVGWDYSSAANGIYTLLAGGAIDLSSGVAHVGLGNALSLGGGRSAYFQQGSLQVVVIPEPRAALIGGLGLLALLRRRRA